MDEELYVPEEWDSDECGYCGRVILGDHYAPPDDLQGPKFHEECVPRTHVDVYETQVLVEVD